MRDPGQVNGGKATARPQVWQTTTPRGNNCNTTAILYTRNTVTQKPQAATRRDGEQMHFFVASTTRTTERSPTFPAALEQNLCSGSGSGQEARTCARRD